MKRGQAAMEFLMTYGWAILVVLAAIGALAYFGVLSPDRLLPSKCTLSPGFDFGDCKADATTESLRISIYNGLGTDVKNVTFVVNTTGGSDITCSETWDIGILANGATIPTSGAYELCNETAATGDYAEGTRFDASVKVVYTKFGESVSHTVTGKITTKVEI
ncbi:hypothetical protein AYK26_00390 [Euryarchaeota archaeon SM23-78]|nr:MAG: hypothetical protein AYK26_00390 [Euryarchaeota archaeon SM23-78]MBW3001126.1 hypothetical protein [Candidatus Woesearchaeota archaeon]